jgi:signal transduction histidine kinase
MVPVASTALCDAVDAILGNVFAHTPEGSPLAVSLAVLSDPEDHEKRSVLLRVDDQGPGFRDAMVLERGVSGGGSTGLGLDIARRVAESSGGHLRLSRSALGGARVELVLPGQIGASLEEDTAQLAKTS